MGEEKKEEEKKEESKDEKKEEETKEEKKEEEPPEIVLKVDMHCEACARKVARALKGFEGVEDVTTDNKASKVVVKGKAANPIKVCERLQKKSGKKVELISPLPKPPEEKKEDQQVKEADKEEKKDEPPAVVTVVLQVRMHCEACAQVLQKRIRKIQGADFVTNWNAFYTRIKDREEADEILQEFAYGLWRLWKNRNDAVFKGMSSQPMDILSLWRKNIGEYREASKHHNGDENSPQMLPLISANRLHGHWVKPKFGFFKINTDASWCNNSLRGGTGWVIRDFAGILHAAGGSGTGVHLSAAVAEASAIRAGLHACLEFGFENVCVESDAKSIIQMINKEAAPDCSFECILGDIEVLATRLTSVTFAFVPRECNRAAHSVAKFVFKTGKDFIWDHVGPEFLFNVLARDVNLSIRI